MLYTFVRLCHNYLKNLLLLGSKKFYSQILGLGKAKTVGKPRRFVKGFNEA